MAFNDIEVSEYGNAPIETYDFVRNGEHWRYTSSDEDFLPTPGELFRSVPIKRGRIMSTQDIGKTSLKIRISRRAEVVDQYIATSPTDIIKMTLTRYHAGDVANPAITFTGRIINVKFMENEVEIIIQPIFSALKRPGLRRVYQATCPHVLYGTSCRAAAATFSTTQVLSDVSGNSITSAGFIRAVDPTYDAAYYAGGYVEFLINTHTERRFITAYDNASGTLTLNLPFTDLVAGNSVKAFAGCNHSRGDCNGKFNNLLNFGGFPFIPQKNPMDGTAIF